MKWYKKAYAKLCALGAYIMGVMILALSIITPTALVICLVKWILNMLGVV